MERSHRVVLFSIATISVIALYTKGHRPSYDDGKVAFSPSGTTGIIVKVKGPGRSSGVYNFEGGAVARDVILLTVGSSSPYMTENRLLERILKNGDNIELSVDDQQHLLINMKRMKALEMMLLGITLYPDELDSDDWESLPGIGPLLARRIAAHRQKNGDFGSFEAVTRVPGIGEKKYSLLKKYFN